MPVEFFYGHVLYFGEFFGDKWDVAGMAGLAAEGDGRHVRGVGLQKHLVNGDDGGGVTHVLGVVERDDSRESDENLGVEGEEAFDEFGRAGKTVDMDFTVVQVRGAEYGEGIVFGFAKMQHERLPAFDTELQVSFEELYLSGLCFGAVVVIEPEFPAGDALGVLQKFHHVRFVFGSFRFDVLGMDAVGGIDERIFFAQGAGRFEVRRVTGHVDKRIWACDFGCGCLFLGGTAVIGEIIVLETREERVEGFACMAFVRINMAMSIDEHCSYLVRHFQNLIRDFPAGGLYLDDVAGFFALQRFADGGFHADAPLQRVDFLVADDAIDFLTFGLLVEHLDRRTKADGTVLGGCVLDDFCPVQNAVQFAQTAVNLAYAHASVRVGCILAAVTFCRGCLDLVNHGRSFDVFEVFPFGLELLKALF